MQRFGVLLGMPEVGSGVFARAGDWRTEKSKEGLTVKNGMIRSDFPEGPIELLKYIVQSAKMKA